MGTLGAIFVPLLAASALAASAERLPGSGALRPAAKAIGVGIGYGPTGGRPLTPDYTPPLPAIYEFINENDVHGSGRSSDTLAPRKDRERTADDLLKDSESYMNDFYVPHEGGEGQGNMILAYIQERARKERARADGEVSTDDFDTADATLLAGNPNEYEGFMRDPLEDGFQGRSPNLTQRLTRSLENNMGLLQADTNIYETDQHARGIKRDIASNKYDLFNAEEEKDTVDRVDTPGGVEDTDLVPVTGSEEDSDWLNIPVAEIEEDGGHKEGTAIGEEDGEEERETPAVLLVKEEGGEDALVAYFLEGGLGDLSDENPSTSFILEALRCGADHKLALLFRPGSPASPAQLRLRRRLRVARLEAPAGASLAALLRLARPGAAAWLLVLDLADLPRLGLSPAHLNLPGARPLSRLLASLERRRLRSPAPLPPPPPRIRAPFLAD